MRHYFARFRLKVCYCWWPPNIHQSRKHAFLVCPLQFVVFEEVFTRHCDQPVDTAIPPLTPGPLFHAVCQAGLPIDMQNKNKKHVTVSENVKILVYRGRCGREIQWLRRLAAVIAASFLQVWGQPPKSLAIAIFLRPEKQKTLRSLQLNDCEPTCGHCGHCDFAMRVLCH